MELIHDLNYLLISPCLFRKSWTLQSILSVSEPQHWPRCFCHSAKSDDDGAIPAHQLWEAFDEVTWCTQGKGGAGGGPAALFMPPSARSSKALPHTPVASEFRCQGCVTSSNGARNRCTEPNLDHPAPPRFGSQLHCCLHLKQGYLCEWNLGGQCTEANKHQGKSAVKTEINTEIITAVAQRGHQDFRDSTWNINAAQMDGFLTKGAFLRRLNVLCVVVFFVCVCVYIKTFEQKTNQNLFLRFPISCWPTELHPANLHCNAALIECNIHSISPSGG